MLHPDDTIVAIASAPGLGARGIIRISGPGALACLAAVAPEQHAPLQELRSATAIDAVLHLAEWGRTVAATAYVWPTAVSYTRQPTVELHLVGSLPLLAAVARALCAGGARQAAPGEFSLRAFLAGRLDLTQAEAVLGVIDAADRRQLDAALAQLAGGLATPLRQLRSDLLDLLADLEAGLDFVEEDIEFVRAEEVAARLRAAQCAVTELARQMQGRDRQGGLPRVALAGAPNAGKSSLFNALCGRSAALVTPEPGATRDYLTAEVDFDGFLAELVDTAGLSEAAVDPIDRAAQTHSRRQHAQADVLLLCLDSAQSAVPSDAPTATDETPRAGRIVVHTKCDAPPALPRDPQAVCVSAHTGAGLDELRRGVGAVLRADRTGRAAVVAGTSLRCRESVSQAAESLSRAVALHTAAAGDELLAAELRLALDELGKVAGTVYTEDVLDRIFGRFCIGK